MPSLRSSPGVLRQHDETIRELAGDGIVQPDGTVESSRGNELPIGVPGHRINRSRYFFADNLGCGIDIVDSHFALAVEAADRREFRPVFVEHYSRNSPGHLFVLANLIGIIAN